MYFDRKRIKEAAKVALKRSHWMVVLVMLIAGLLGGTLADKLRPVIDFRTADPEEHHENK